MKLSVLSIFCVICGFTNAQFKDLVIQEIDNYGIVKGTTYRIYVELASEYTDLRTVYGDRMHPLKISSSRPFYQCPYGGNLATEVSSLLLSEKQELQFDSWVTIGRENNLDNFVSNFQIDFSDFEKGGNIETSDGAWFCTPENSQTWGSQNRFILIAQLTTEGVITGSISLMGKYKSANEDLVWEETDLNFTCGHEPIQTPHNSDSFGSIAPASGTGFGLASDGLVVTNSHVISGASIIKIRGINGDFTKLYEAKLIIEDRVNDLALLQIVDESFTTLGTIPFTIASKSSDVGSEVFVLGYPLRAVMGEEIKLTNGIISSKSGFQGDVTSYQISVPVQPGNSGGPLFDSNGYLVGVVNAKLSIGENVSYAVKSSYLANLLEMMPTQPKLSNINSLTGKPLTEQVKALDNYVYIIETN